MIHQNHIEETMTKCELAEYYAVKERTLQRRIKILCLDPDTPFSYEDYKRFRVLPQRISSYILLNL